MRMDIPFEGKRVSSCQKCGQRTMTTNGFCDRCRSLGFGVERSKFYDKEEILKMHKEKQNNENQSIEDKAKSRELERLKEARRRELEEPPTNEEIEDILKRRTKIYDRKKEKKESPIPETVDARIKG